MERDLDAHDDPLGLASKVTTRPRTSALLSIGAARLVPLLGARAGDGTRFPFASIPARIALPVIVDRSRREDDGPSAVYRSANVQPMLNTYAVAKTYTVVSAFLLTSAREPRAGEERNPESRG
jgi:hypothetical protein